ncbi:MAG: multiheme c-type cytochrome [Planctomycetota bacterium]
MNTRRMPQLVPGILGLCIALSIAAASCEVPPAVGPAAPTPVSQERVEAAPQQPVEAVVAKAQPAAREPVAQAPAAQEPGKPAAAKPESRRPEPVAQDPVSAAPERDIAEHAFPPVMPDIEQHKDAWLLDSCLRCHETGVEKAPPVRHVDLPAVLLTAKCRTCHVFVPGQQPRERPKVVTPFDDNAFPPMIPASADHGSAWWRDDCLLCHEDGTHGAPKIEHEGMPRLLLKSKCRSCHVQVRAVEADDGSPRR